MVSGQYRALTGDGAYQVTGYLTYGSRVPLNSAVPLSEKDVRGYLFANGRFQLDPNWSVTGSLRYASDRTFLRRYDISRDDPLLGGQIELQANSLAITRTSGQDTQRAFARAQWQFRRITGWGQEVTLTALLRGDVYHSDENLLTVTPSYRGEMGWEARGVAIGAVDVKWPFVGSFLGATQVFTPRVQFVASPSLKNLDIPNEDARSIDLDDSNLFALNRF